MRAQLSAEYDWWFRAAYPRITRTVFLILRDREQAEEVAQDAFVQLYRHWSTVQGYERPDLWVRRVAIRLAIRQVKRERMRKQRERLAIEPHEEHVPDVDLAQALSRLSPMQRTAVVLHYWSNDSVFDIALTLGVSESTVKQHLFRARSRLAGLLGETVNDDVG